MIRTSHANSAHPRSRGEHSRGRASRTGGSGSSPLTRGARRSIFVRPTLPRLIPAHAGSTSLMRTPLRSSPAHPRSRGEHARGSSASIPLFGSSPLTRGAPYRRVVLAIGTRLIPAHAGSTAHLRGPGEDPPAHPRSRGEHTVAFSWRVSLTGSSPLTRGAQSGAQRDAYQCRLIPAHAGSTSSNSRPRGSRTAHPRSRGEHPYPRCWR